MAEISLKYLSDYLARELSIHEFQDYCPNGLQIEGKPVISKIISGVSANDALITKAIECQADILLVHHGFFWKGEEACLTGLRYRRIAKLIKHDIALLAYHLPLDVHPFWGNNVQLAKFLGFQQVMHYPAAGISSLFNIGELEKPLEPQAFQAFLMQRFNRPILWLPAKEQNIILKIGWCTGAAQDFIHDAHLHGCNAFISGEVSERTTALAEELNCHYFACGHHATEQFGVKALGEHLAEKFGLEHQFINIENPI